MFATWSSGKLGIIAMRDGATFAKWLIKVEAIVEDSVILSLFTLSFIWCLKTIRKE